MAVNSTTSATGTDTTQDSVSRSVKSALGKDDFLKLLMAQLTHQDPLAPSDNKDFIAQMAQFSSLEQMTNMSQGFNRLAMLQETLFREASVGQAINLIGKRIEAQLPDQEQPVTGIVQGMKIVEGEPMVVVDGKEISLGYISSVFSVDSSGSAGTGTSTSS